MLKTIKQLFGLSAPPTALAQDSDTMLIGQARERVSAVWEGEELIHFLDDTGYHLSIEEFTISNATAFCEPVTRSIMFNRLSATADRIAASLPHEAFHGVQFDQVPSLLNFGACMILSGDEPRVYFDEEDPVDILHPDDMIYAYNVLEMGAFAMQSHVVNKMARDAGDVGAVNSAIRDNDHSVPFYQRIFDIPEISHLQFGDVPIIDAPRTNVVEKHGAEAVATTVTAHNWFWNMIDEDKTPTRLTYNAPKSELLLTRVFNEESPYFAMKRAGYKFDFQPLSKAQARLLGTGCGQNMFSLPDFADVTSAAYRQEITAESLAHIAKVNAKLGLKLL